MNPEEGNLRPQLLDRFGLMVDVTAETDARNRAEILKTVLQFDQAMLRLKRKQPVPFIEQGRQKDEEHKTVLEKAKENLDEIEVSEQIVNNCVALATEFEVEGNRGDYMIALAARAYAARAYAAGQGTLEVTSEHIKVVAPLAIQHRRPEFLKSDQTPWSSKDDQKVAELLNNV
jgi:magnesium chelatase subunit I